MTETMMGHAGDSQVVVLAGSALRAAPLETMAEALRRCGARVEVVAGVDRRRVELLKLSFRHRAHACYVLLGGPALREDVQRSIATELEANGVPANRISRGPCAWDDEAGLVDHVVDRLATLGISLTSSPAVKPAATVPPPRPAPSPAPASAGPTPPTPNIPPTRQPIPSVNVPALSASSNTSMGRLSAVPRAAWAIGGGVALVAVLGLAVSSGGAEATEDPSSDNEAAMASVMAAAETPPEIEPAPVAEPMPQAEADIELDVDPEPAEAVETPELPADPVVRTGDDADLVYAALRKQSIRALDILLVSPPATKKRGRRARVVRTNFESARAYCQGLDIEGVVGWRLPDIGEAKWISRSNMIQTGVYWTATKADAFGDERVTWNPRAKKMRATGQRWRGGKVVCVRFANPDDSGPG